MEISSSVGKPARPEMLVGDRIEAEATPEQKEKLKKLSASQIKHKDLAGEEIKLILTNASGNNAPIGGLKVITENGWCAAGPSGTEDIYKIYGESFVSKDHLEKIIDEAQTIVKAALQTN
jgi:phosphoglucomutase